MITKLSISMFADGITTAISFSNLYLAKLISNYKINFERIMYHGNET